MMPFSCQNSDDMMLTRMTPVPDVTV